MALGKGDQDDIKGWTNMSIGQLVRLAEDRKAWRDLVKRNRHQRARPGPRRSSQMKGQAKLYLSLGFQEKFRQQVFLANHIEVSLSHILDTAVLCEGNVLSVV